MMDFSSQHLTPDSLHLVMNFLRRNCLTETEDTLSREAAAVLRLTKEVAEGDTTNDAVVREFGAFLLFISTTFDNYRAELTLLLFPIFAHLYIQLVLESHNLLAAVFSEKYEKCVPSMYEEYVHKLCRISTHGQAANHPLVQTLTKNAFNIRLSRSAFKQLETFLGRHPIIRDLIRDHVAIELVEGSRTKSNIDVSVGGILGYISKIDRKHKMYYGTIKEDFSSSLSGDKKKSKGKDRNEAKRKDANGPSVDRIPLPPLYERSSASREVCTSKRQRISLESPPSICLYTALNPQGCVTSATFAEDSSFIAVGYGSSRIQLTSLSKNLFRPLKRIDHLECIDQESDDIMDQIYDENQCTETLSFVGHHGPIYSVSVSPDKRLLLSSSRDSTVRLWSLDVRQNVVLYRQSLPIWQAQFCPRSYYFATGGADGTAMLWATDRLQPLRVFPDALSDVTCIDFHPNCNYIAGGSDDRYVRVWDVLSGSCVRTFSGHKGTIQAVKNSPCGRYLASLGAEGTLAIWDMSNQKMLSIIDVAPFPFKSCLAFSRDGGTLAVGRADSAISFYSVDSVTSSTNLQDNPTPDPKINPNGFHMFTYATKNSPIIDIHFTRRNLVLAVASYGQ